MRLKEPTLSKEASEEEAAAAVVDDGQTVVSKEKEPELFNLPFNLPSYEETFQERHIDKNGLK